MSRRVVVTGLGVASPFGRALDAFWDGLVSGRSAAEPFEAEAVGTVPAVVVDGADAAAARFGARDARRMSRAGRLAALAVADALEDAGLGDTPHDGVGLSLGCVHGGAEAWFTGHDTLRERGADRVSPLTVPLGLTNSPAAGAARVLGLTGPSLSVTTACAAATDAIGQALAAVRAGRADVVVAGGAEAPLSPLVIGGYAALGALSRRQDAAVASRPFDAGRDGFVIAEGAGVIVLEEEGHARARGARVYGELAGYGSSCDAGHLTDPDPTGAGPARAIAEAMADARIAPGDVGYVNAHATSTPVGDVAESRALVAAGLGACPVSSTKGAHGHALGAAGGIEAAACLLALTRGVLPPTANLDAPDPAVALDLVREARAADARVALSTSFGFGGHNAVLVFRRRDAPA